MRARNGAHWLLQRVAEEQAPRATIDLWPGIEARATRPSRAILQGRLRAPAARAVVAVALVLLLAGSLALVPGVRAFGEGMLQRMGIALVDTAVEEERSAPMVRLEATRVVDETPALTMEEALARIDFDVRLPTWLPEGFAQTHVSVTDDWSPDDAYGAKLGIEYRQVTPPGPGDGILVMHASKGLLGAPPVLAEAAEQAVSVRGLPGVYVHGGWQDDGTGDPGIRMGSLLWDEQADDAYLTWEEDGVTYLLEAHNLGLQFEDLLRMAEALE